MVGILYVSSIQAVKSSVASAWDIKSGDYQSMSGDFPYIEAKKKKRMVEDDGLNSGIEARKKARKKMAEADSLNSGIEAKKKIHVKK